MFYWFLKWVAIGPLLRVIFRPVVQGEENVPEEGPAILASNHLSYADWLFMPLTLLSGLWGMNIPLPHFPGSDVAQFWWLAGIMVIIASSVHFATTSPATPPIAASRSDSVINCTMR